MEKMVGKVRIKYPWLSYEEASQLVENGIGWYFACRYPSEPSASLETHPLDTFMDRWAVERFCDEIAARNGFNSAVGYRENGLQLTFDSAWISEGLRKSIVPTVGVI